VADLARCGGSNVQQDSPSGMHRPYEKRYLVGSFDPSYALRFIFQGKGTGAVTGGAGGGPPLELLSRRWAA
jgi:hypothetical protein